MPTREHEMWLELLRDRPALTADLLECVRPGLVPEYSRARVESGDLSEYKPASYHADAVVTLGGEQPALAVVVEVQLRRDPRKHLSWPAYLATARARLSCPTLLLVISPNVATAEWARHPIPLGHPDLTLKPLVLGPENIPMLTPSRSAAIEPELAMVSALVHGPGPGGTEVFTAMLQRLESIEFEKAQGYIDEVLALLPEAARTILEAMMTTGTREYKSDFARRYYGEGIAEGELKGKAEGRAEGRAETILDVLAVRGVEVSEEARVRIAECTDLEQLGAWVPRALTVTSVEDLFE